MLDIWRRREAMTDELAPLVEIRRLAEILGVIFHRFPLHKEPVTLWHFVRALQGHELAAFGALEDRRGFFNAGFKFGFHAGLHVDLGNFEDHGTGPCGTRRRQNASTGSKMWKETSCHRVFAAAEKAIFLVVSGFVAHRLEGADLRECALDSVALCNLVRPFFDGWVFSGI